MKIDTTYYERCVHTLAKAYGLLLKSDPENIDYDMYRSASIKEFEIILEQSGKLLRKALKPYFHSPQAVDQLYFKDIFRHAVLRSLITDESCERWLRYRDNRNNTAHDYGVNFAEETLRLLPQFMEDATALAEVIRQQNVQ
ncbi:nucleotidyltransferase substrate binding protein [Dyadobacter arcticus]|uniref:Nucleotidyltransferase substrate binding protein (TIGR01987 family) n=1 Tax=Dyadobacter arcticus TaxID=1078754 RepID=A0ABX0US72_9BACT|nr:nucleotidyltransferase substrate binding protein [Dyadobacter arcticus]NIJ53826.1 nucleotidyltransferase substrate binding protein (TIGR01987 family) [Dyadobacter arcticus]